MENLIPELLEEIQEYVDERDWEGALVKTRELREAIEQLQEAGK